MASSSKRRKSPSIKTRWPITIIINRCLVEGESRNITANGILARCKEPLHEDETYRIVITLPQKRYIAVRGKVLWSNLDGVDPNGTFSDMAFYFVEMPEEDRVFLNHAVSAQHT
ncbi:MAG: PilZ domain-containing protein [Desulfobacteraceae bacterium]|nr:PilZ domain-containing protein [Desulfobacteraceae bacterium]